MKRVRTVNMRMLGIALVCLLPMSATAQSEWEFALTPYLWGAGLNGDIRIGPIEDNVNASFSDILGSLELAGMATFEANNGRVGVLVDAFYVDLADEAEPPGPVFDRADVDITQQMWSVVGTYRVMDDRAKVDLLLGVRYMYIKSDLQLVRESEVTRRAATSADWADGVFGARVRFDISEKWWFTGVGDLGKGESEFSYQVLLGLGYGFSERMSVAFWAWRRRRNGPSHGTSARPTWPRRHFGTVRAVRRSA